MTHNKMSLTIGVLLIASLSGCEKEPVQRAEVTDIRMPDGTVIQDVPKDTTRSELIKHLQDACYKTEQTLASGSEAGMVVDGPLNGTLMPGSRGGMVVGGPLNGTLMPPSD